ncbi:MAG: tetratricopeptide repeat protein [Chloroflexi bacterium]|nr:tetratricopeptide repeat protein [Chloroflexota bacterium]
MDSIETGLPDFDALWDYNNPSETEARFRMLLTTLDTSQDRNYHAQLLTQLARGQGLQRNFEGAHRTLDQAEALLTPDMAVAWARYLLERGRVFNSSGSRDKARPFFLGALAAAQEAGAQADYHAVDAAHMLGIIEPPDEALEWNLKAVEMAGQSENSHVRTWLGSLYNNIGWTFHSQGKYKQALDAFHKSYDAWSDNGTAKNRNARIARWCIARTLRSLGRLDEALQSQLEIVAEAEAEGDESGYGNEEIAECLLALGQPEAARPYAQKAFVILSRDPWLPTDEPERLERLQKLGGPASQQSNTAH